MVNANMIMLVVLSTLLYILVPPLADGFERKIRAKIQSRVGPPTVLQTWYDLLKLLSKETLVPVEAPLVLPLLSLLLTLLITTMYVLSQVITCPVLDLTYVVVLLVLLMSAHGVSMVLYTLSSNPFSIIGAFRVLLLDVLNETALVTFFALAVSAVKSGSGLLPTQLVIVAISTVVLIVSSYALSRRLPYDLHEAEPELASGSIIDFSGPVLATYLYSFITERYLYTSLPVTIVLLTIAGNANSVICVLALHAITTLVYVVYSVAHTIVGRSRVDLAVKVLACIYLVALTASLAVYATSRYIAW